MKRFAVYFFLLLPITGFAQNVIFHETRSQVQVNVSFDHAQQQKILKGDRPEGFIGQGTPGAVSYAKVLHVAVPPSGEISLQVSQVRSAAVNDVGASLPSYPESSVVVSMRKVFRQVS